MVDGEEKHIGSCYSTLKKLFLNYLFFYLKIHPQVLTVSGSARVACLRTDLTCSFVFPEKCFRLTCLLKCLLLSEMANASLALFSNSFQLYTT